jgi:hypothetical protein
LKSPAPDSPTSFWIAVPAGKDEIGPPLQRVSRSTRRRPRFIKGGLAHTERSSGSAPSPIDLLSSEGQLPGLLEPRRRAFLRAGHRGRAKRVDAGGRCGGGQSPRREFCEFLRVEFAVGHRLSGYQSRPTKADHPPCLLDTRAHQKNLVRRIGRVASAGTNASATRK